MNDAGRPGLPLEPRRGRHVTIRDEKAELPYSKGLMANSIMAAGLPPSRAYSVAERIEVWLHEHGCESATTEELSEIAYQVLEDSVGVRYAENYRQWQAAQNRKMPLIVLIGGTTGVGKSTVATTLASRLGIVRIVSTDAVREVMRGVITKEMMPALHASSFDVASVLREPPGDADPVIAGFREQVHAVAVGVSKIIRRAVMEGTDVIVEGAHVVPGFLDPPTRENAIVAQLVIAVDDPEIHRSHFVARGQDARSRGYQRYLDYLSDIRTIQDYIRSLALEHGVPIVTSYSLDATVSQVMELVVAASTEVMPQRHDPKRSRPMALHDSSDYSGVRGAGSPPMAAVDPSPDDQPTVRQE